MRIGLISDTHGLVRPEALRALRGVDAILHAGDVGKPEVLEALGEIAPTYAVLGNVDAGKPGLSMLPEALTIDLGVRFYVTHVRDDTIDLQGVDAVVTGHSHKPRIEQIGSLWWLNPGSAGPRRFKLPVCVGLVEIRRRRIAPRIVPLIP